MVVKTQTGYKYSKAIRKKGMSHAGPPNWSTAAELRADKTRWYFVGVDGKGRRVKGEAVIGLKADVDPMNPEDPEYQL